MRGSHSEIVKANVPEGTFDRLIPPKEIAENLKENVLPQFLEVYERSRSEFTAKGWQVVQRALKKPTLRTEEGLSRLYEPAIILALTTRIDLLWEIYEISKQIPFWGNIQVVYYVARFNNIMYTKLALANDPRKDEVEQRLWVPSYDPWSFCKPEYEDIDEILEGSRFDYLESHHGIYNYKSPMPAYEWDSFGYTLNELYIMWANGGSEKWPIERIEEALDKHAEFLKPWLVRPPVWGGNSIETLPESSEDKIKRSI
ncbi:hypothetical protein FCOIX_14053 [Fusarium coicis]|nr:hypothetical protein FCOIX_14053 [Fusarium coicis]